MTKPDWPLTALMVYCLNGEHYALALDGIRDWWSSEDARWSYVQMSQGSSPILIVGTPAQITEAYAKAAQCRIPKPKEEVK